MRTGTLCLNVARVNRTARIVSGSLKGLNYTLNSPPIWYHRRARKSHS